jgi:hypothetical protein
MAYPRASVGVRTLQLDPRSLNIDGRYKDPGLLKPVKTNRAVSRIARQHPPPWSMWEFLAYISYQ